MAHYVIEFKETTRKKWHLVERIVSKEVAYGNVSKYRKHIRKQDEIDGMEYRIRKVKGNIDEPEAVHP